MSIKWQLSPKNEDDEVFKNLSQFYKTECHFTMATMLTCIQIWKYCQTKWQLSHQNVDVEVCKYKKTI